MFQSEGSYPTTNPSEILVAYPCWRKGTTDLCVYK